MKSVAFFPEASNPRIEFTSQNKNGLQITETIPLKFVYGQIDGENGYTQVYIVENAYYYDEFIIDVLEEAESNSKYRIEPESRVTIENKITN